MIPFYDNLLLDPDNEGWVDIERIYCFDWDAFDQQSMDSLRAIFSSFPESKKSDLQDCFWWYSDREDIENGYLTASLEPPGLQVYGALQFDVWQKWDRSFQALVSDLPARIMIQ